MARILITGASNGIGRALAARLTGHELVLAGRNAERLAEVSRDIPSARIITPDFLDPASIAEHVSDIAELDGLVHVAGISDRALLPDALPEHWGRQLTVNLLSPVELTRLLLPALTQTRGTVVFVNSVVALAGGGAGGASYVASKVALRSFADQLRVEQPTLRVGTVYPGRTATEMQRELRAFEGLPYEAESYASAESVAAAIETVLFAPADVSFRDLTVMPR